MKIYRETAYKSIGIHDVEQLGIECSAATGVTITVSIARCRDIGDSHDPTCDRVIYTCASQPNEDDLDAAIAAYPDLAP